MKIYERNEFWIIVAVVVGFLLSILWEVGRYRYALRKKRKAIESELKTNLGLIPQKIDILVQAKNSFSNQRVLPTPSVHFHTYIYNSLVGDVGPNLSYLKRENLHIIYESLKVADTFMDSLFNDFMQSRASGQLDDPFDAYKNMCEDMIGKLDIINELIGQYLKDKPIKVTWDKIN